MNLITGFKFKSLCDYHYVRGEQVPLKSIKEVNIIGCYGHDLQYLLEYCKSLPQHLFRIISHNSDACVVPFKWREFDCFIETKLPDNIELYAQNLDYFDINAKPIPIGIENENWHKGQKFSDIINVRQVKTTPHGLVYVNVETSTNPIERQLCVELIKKQIPGATIISSKKPYKSYINDMKFHKYTACPDGNGFDCHRTWEALYMGSIPIVKKHAFTLEFKRMGFPLLVIDDWHEVTEERLNKEYKAIKLNDKSKILLDFDWWKSEIRR